TCQAACIAGDCGILWPVAQLPLQNPNTFVALSETRNAPISRTLPTRQTGKSEVSEQGLERCQFFGFGISLQAWKPAVAQEPCLPYCYTGGVGCTLSVSREVKKILMQRYWP